MNFDLNFIITRSKNILIKPLNEWLVINSETIDRKKILTSFLLPFVIAIFIASLVGYLQFFDSKPFIFIFLTALVNALTNLVGIYLSAFIITKIAHYFSSKIDFDSTFKLVVYSSVPSLILSIITGLVPSLADISILGLYSIYIMWAGLSIIMEIPEHKKINFLIVSTLILLLTYFVVAAILYTIFNPFLFTTLSTL